MSDLFTKYLIPLKNQNAKSKQVLQHVFITYGSDQSGKSKIISKLGVQQADNISRGVGYSYSRTNIVGDQAILQFYEISGTEFKDLITLHLNKSNYKTLSYLLVLDLTTNPHDILQQLEKQIDFIRIQQQQKLEQILTLDEYKVLDQFTYDQLQNHHDKSKIRPSHIPITIIGWKYDEFIKNLDQETRKWICKGIRYLALINNCSIAFGDQDEFQNVRLIINYNVKKGHICQTDHLKQLCISQLQDTIEQIGMPQSFSSHPLDGFIKIIKDQVTIDPKFSNKKNKIHLIDNIELYKEDRIDKLIQQIQKNDNQEFII